MRPRKLGHSTFKIAKQLIQSCLTHQGREIAARQNVTEGLYYVSSLAPVTESTLRTGAQTKKVNITLGSLPQDAEFEAPLPLLMAVTALALSIACCNPANPLLGRSAARIHEIGVRLAMGVGR